MSRFTINHDKFTYSYGVDQILGIFFEKRHFEKNVEITDFDISEVVNFINHKGKKLTYDEILEIIEWEVRENNVPINLEHLEKLRVKELT